MSSAHKNRSLSAQEIRCGRHRTILPFAIGVFRVNGKFKHTCQRWRTDYVPTQRLSWVKRWESEFDRKLFIGNDAKDTMCVSIWTVYCVAISVRVTKRTQKDVNGVGSTPTTFASLTLAPIEGGDAYLQPMNMVKVGRQPRRCRGIITQRRRLIMPTCAETSRRMEAIAVRKWLATCRPGSKA